MVSAWTCPVPRERQRGGGAGERGGERGQGPGAEGEHVGRGQGGDCAGADPVTTAVPKAAPGH